MQIKEALCVANSSQSMVTKGICVLVVNEDLTCNNIVSEMLHHCNYEVLHIGGVSDVLNAIRQTKDKLDLILTNVHKLETNGVQIVRNIQKQLNLEIMLMFPDTINIALKGQPFSFAAYVLNGLSRNAVNNLWQFALKKEKAKMVNMSDNAVEKKTAPTSIGEPESFNYKRKRKEDDEKSEGVNEDQRVSKKIRVNWTGEMHQKFLEAIEVIGYEKAVPKKIVEVMNIPGLTRENVASHLQKFRGGLKRTQEIALSTLSNNRVTKEFTSFLPSQSTSRLDYSYLTRPSYNPRHVQQRPYISNYLNTHDNFSFRAKYYQNITDFQNKYTPLSPNFRVYGDQMKNMLLSVNKGTDKFVGYRLTNDGNSIEFGKLDNKISKDVLDSAPTSWSPAGADEYQAQCITMPVRANNVNLSQCPSAPDENQAQCIIMPVRPNNVNLPKCPSMPTSSVLELPDREFSLPLVETHENDFVVQDSSAFFEGILVQDSFQDVPQDLSDFFYHEGIDDVPLDWAEFDEAFFNHVESSECDNKDKFCDSKHRN